MCELTREKPRVGQKISKSGGLIQKKMKLYKGLRNAQVSLPNEGEQLEIGQSSFGCFLSAIAKLCCA